MNYDNQESSESESDATRCTLDESEVDTNSDDYDSQSNENGESDYENFSGSSNSTTNESDVSDGSDDKENDPDDDYRLSTNISDVEMWSGESLRTNLPDYDGTLRLSRDIAMNFPKNPSPIDIFRLFLTPEITNYIVDQSNLYRTQNNLTKQDPMTEDDLHSLLGFLYYSSIVPLPSKSDY